MSVSEARDFSMDVHHNLEQWVTEGCPFSDDEWAVLKALYDAEIKYTDTFVGQLVDVIESQFEDSIIVVTADHGENFGEQGALAHRYLLDDAGVNVPLVIHGLPGVSRTDQMIQHTDVIKALLKEAGANTEGIQDSDFREHVREFAYIQDSSVSLDHLLAHNPSFDTSKFFPTNGTTIPERSAIRTQEYKYIEDVVGTSVLYELGEEGEDIKAELPEVGSTLGEQLNTWLEAQETPSTATEGHELSAGVKARLADMGYLDDEIAK